MDVTPLIKKGQQIIQSYSGGKFKISGNTYNNPVIVMPERTQIWDIHPDSTLELLQETDFNDLIALKDNVDVILLGCGVRMEFLPKALKVALKGQGLHVETMDTGAACRTYNVLMAEGRRVCALLLRCL